MRLALISALFLVPFAAPFLVRWVRARRWGLPVCVAMGPDAPRTEVLGGYLAEIACRLDERPERMRVVFDGGGSRDLAISLDVLPDRTLRVSVDGHRPRRVDLRGNLRDLPLLCRKSVAVSGRSESCAHLLFLLKITVFCSKPLYKCGLVRAVIACLTVKIES